MDNLVVDKTTRRASMPIELILQPGDAVLEEIASVRHHKKRETTVLVKVGAIRDVGLPIAQD